MDLINNQQVGKDIHETFHRELDNQQDKFGVIAEFLGRRLFDKVINHFPFISFRNILSFLGIKYKNYLIILIYF